MGDGVRHEYVEEIEAAGRSANFVTQLFGVPNAIQNDSTPHPRNDCADQPYAQDGWIHLATIDADIFEYYFTVRQGNLVGGDFEGSRFDAQCD